MKAVVGLGDGTVSKADVSVDEVPDPLPGPGEVLVAVRAAGLNSADRLQAMGFYPPPPGAPHWLGLELAGEVADLGAGADRFAVGDRVMAVVAGGGQAERAVVHERHLMPVPDELDWPAAGGFPEAFTTAHDALFTQCHLAMGDRALVHGAAGGVGIAGVQLCAAAGAEVVATVRSAALRAEVGRLGGSRCTVTGSEPEAFEALGPFDVVLELVGGVNMATNLKSLSTGGRISVIGVGGGGGRTELDLLTLMQRRARIHGSTLRPRSLEEKADAARRVERQVLPLVRSGALTVPVEATFPLEEAAAAFERFAAGGKLGKIVLTVS